ncbi:MBL fold metallo-hydrolase [Bacillus salitolerans]|uniref:MBL fold metallo-hydrolase n=1 Tax=Bacillus salitolerans TaxID=1437434 RepID=A0ABW4LV43_9BACI
MKTQKIKKRNILFTDHTPWGWDLNCHLILGNQYNYIIDTGLGSLSTAPIKDFIKDDNKPMIVINTHYHWDHIWGNGSFENCTIISHKLCREMIESNWEDMMKTSQQFIRGDTTQCLPNMTFENELYFPEDQIRIMYTPGHTVDSISVLDEAEKVLHVGDNVGDSLEQLIPSLKVEKEVYMNTLLKYRELDFDTCVSGHNIILDKSVIEKIINMI